MEEYYIIPLSAKEIDSRLKKIPDLAVDIFCNNPKPETDQYGIEYIAVTIKYEIADGLEIKFKLTTDCVNATKLVVNGQNEDRKVFTFVDANRKDIGKIGKLFAEGAIIKVILDLDQEAAFVQNADTPAGKVYTATPDTLADIINSATAGATINLTAGKYDKIELCGPDAYSENLTILGPDNIENTEDIAEIAGVSITSGVLSSDVIKEGSSDTTNAILPKGLTFRNVTFSSAFSLRNARVDDLTVENCTFNGCNIFITPESFKDSYGDDLGKGNSSYYRYPQSHLHQKNLTITGCTFNDAAGYQNEEKTSTGSGIHVIGVENVTVSGNTITGALVENKDAKILDAKIHDGIQIGGYNVSPFYVLSHGEIKVTNNVITNCRSRAINVVHIDTGDILVASNKCFNTNTEGKLNKEDINNEAIIVRKSKNVTTSWTINGPIGNDFNLGFGNAWDFNDGGEARKIVVGNGITVSDLTSPKEYTQNLIDFNATIDNLQSQVDSKVNADTKEYKCEVETEEELNIWLDDIFNQMEDYSFKNICVKCKSITDWTLMGTIHKRQIYATVDLTAQINGHHYIKIRNPSNGVNWRPIDKRSIEQQIYERAYKTDLEKHANSTSNPHKVTTDQVGAAPASHLSDENNPHKVTKAQVGLGNVDNTADTNKPISTKQQAALDLKADKTEVLAGLDTKADIIETQTALDAKAPAGFGLGETASGKNRDANAVTGTGWYNCDVNTPDSNWWYGQHIQYANGYAYQRFVRAGTGYVVERTQIAGVWQPWDWVNPPMDPGVEYRTTERWNGKSVYTCLFNCGEAATQAGTEHYDLAVLYAPISFSAILNHRSHIGDIVLPYGSYTGANSWHARVDVSKYNYYEGSVPKYKLQIQLQCFSDSLAKAFVGKNLYTQVWYTKD